MKYYSMIVSFPLDVGKMVSDTEVIERIVGKDATGSGAGFGTRDVDFTFDTKAEVDAAAERLQKEAPYAEVCWIECDDDD